MFTPTDKEKRAFVERTRIERQQREAERLQKQNNAKRDNAANVIQRCWRQHRQRLANASECWQRWESQCQQATTVDDAFRVIGLYCLYCGKRRQQPKPEHLRAVCKVMTGKYFANETKKEPRLTIYTLTVDKRYHDSILRYMSIIITQCIQRVGEDSDLSSTSGPELSLLLQFLNAKTYQISAPIDPTHALENYGAMLPVLSLRLMNVTFLQASFRQAMTIRIQRIVNLQDRNQRQSGKVSPEDAKILRALQLWLTTITRICLFPLESADGNIVDKRQAFRFALANILAIPLLPTAISAMILEHVKKSLDLFQIHQELKRMDTQSKQDLGGNGCLFLLANTVELFRSPQENNSTLLEIANIVLGTAQEYFSDRQSSQYCQYHPVFKWAGPTWGNGIDAPVFERVMRQLEYLWSRTFVDEMFANVLKFEPKSSSIDESVKKPDRLRSRLFKKKQQQTFVDSKEYAPLAEFSVQVEATIRMYSHLSTLFVGQRKEIINRIAFTYRLMPQLWKAMNYFGPRGHLLIFLDAAKRPDGQVDKEPLIKVLQMFCEACSLVFLTLDDTDIFEKETPFSPKELADISGFLNTFYFSLLQQQANTSDTTDASATSSLPSSVQQFHVARRLLLQIYDLDVRHSFCPPDHWLLVSDPTEKSLLMTLFSTSRPNASLFLDRLRQGDAVPLRILQLMPHTIPFQTRLTIFRDWVALDRANATFSFVHTITVRRQFLLEDGFRGLSGIPPAAWKGTIKVKFVNELGAEEAGIDQGGPFKDFVSLLTTKVFEPSFGLFSSTPTTHLCYPSPNSFVHGPQHVDLFEFIGKVVGKAVYEGILLDVQFASFLLSKLLGRNVFLQELRELDEDVWRNLTFVKHYDDCVEDLGLVFATDEESFGKVVTFELKYGGKSISVTNENKVEYVYRMADYKLNQRTREQTRAFIKGFRTVISEAWIKVFSPPELQRVISGEDTDFDVTDLRRHTEYQNGYFDQHPIIRNLWQIVQEFSSEDKRAFLKFVTSCPKPPLGGFDYMQPPFTIRMVPLDTDQPRSADGVGIVKSLLKINNGNTKSGRLPTSSTCFNLLKLPPYTKKSTLREKLCYAIHSNAGFELS